MQITVKLLALLSLAVLSACTSIEHRSEPIQKTPLVALQEEVTLRALWRTKVGVGTSNRDVNLLLGETPDSLIVSDVKGSVMALDVQAGTPLWKTQAPGGVTVGPVVAHSNFMLGLDNARLAAFKVTDGTLLWQVPLSAEILAAPTVSEGVVYAHTLDGALSALSLEDGRQLWRYSLNTPTLLLRRGAKPLIVGEQVINAFANGRVLGVRRLDGMVAWEQEIAIARGRFDLQRMVDLSADPQILGKIVYVVGYRGPLVALDSQKGDILWKKDINSISGFMVNQQHIFVSDTAGVVHALKREQGDPVWQQAALSGRQLTKPSVYQDMIVLGDNEGYVHILSSKDGRLLGRMKVDSKGIAAPIIVRDKNVYVFGNSGSVYAFQIDLMRP